MTLRPRIHALSLVTQTPEEVNADDDGQWYPDPDPDPKTAEKKTNQHIQIALNINIS